MKLQIYLRQRGLAQGRYVIKAKGFIIAILSWGNRDGILPGWGPFAYFPIDPYGNGTFLFPGERAIPYDATHVYAKCISSDFTHFEIMSVEIPLEFRPLVFTQKETLSFSLLTDLHLAAKPWRVRQALRRARGDVIFFAGDSTNDGTEAQFEQLRECVSDMVQDKAIFPVIGNHDVLHNPYSSRDDDCSSYYGFQEYLLTIAREKGYEVSMWDGTYAYSLQIGHLDIIGLQCVVSGRHFSFPEKRQIKLLDNHLNEKDDLSWHIILCHAPLLAHNPNRNEGTPYLDCNKMIQEIIERYGNVIFLSGHTHVSPNVIGGCVEFDHKAENIYINGGSVVPTSLEREEGIMSPDWSEGCVTDILISESNVEICMSSIASGIRFPRGYYRFSDK